MKAEAPRSPRGFRAAVAKGLAWAWIALAVLALAPAAAQDRPQPDWELWDRQASAAQRQIADGSASAADLASARELIETQREAAQVVSDDAAKDVSRLEAELEALGPEPEDAPEAREAAQLRADLSSSLADARARKGRADRVVARSRELRADLIELDQQRFINRLTRIGPSPADPQTWVDAFKLVAGVATDIASEASAALASPSSRRMAAERAPLAVLALAAAVFIAFGLRSAAVGALVRRAQQAGRGGRLILGVGATAARLLSLVVGAICLLFGISSTGLLGPAGQALLSGFAWAIGILVVSYVLAATFFTSAVGVRPYKIEAGAARAAFRWTMLLGFSHALHVFLGRLGGAMGDEVSAAAPLDFIAICIGGIALYFLAKVLGPVVGAAVAAGEAADESAGAPGGGTAFKILRRIAVFVAFAAPTLALVGYSNAAEFLLFPTIRSLALLAVLGLFYVVVREAVEIHLADESREGGDRLRLIPIIAGFLLFCVAVPILALIWGASGADLRDAYTAVATGFVVGDVALSPMDFVTFALVFGIGYTLTRMLQRTLKGSVLPKAGMSAGGADALTSGLGYVGVFLAAIAGISAAGLDLSNLAIVAGALSVGIGFGLQTIVNNFVSGVILLVERPIKVGDWIDVGGAQGYVKKVNVRSTEIETFDRASYIMPNSDLISSPVLNWTHENTLGRVIAPVGVAYGTDPRLVERLLLEVARDHPMIVTSPPPAVYFMNFGSDALEFELRAFLRDVNWMLTVRSDVNFRIAARFAEEGIEIPFPQRDVTFRNPDAVAAALRAQPAAGPAPAAAAEGDPSSAGAKVRNQHRPGEPENDRAEADDGD